MPEQPQEAFIKDLPEIFNPTTLYPTHFEVEDASGAEPVGFKVGFGTVVNAITQALPGANSSKTLYKSVRCYSPQTNEYNAGNETLTGLNEEFLALGAVAYVEFPTPSREYRLVYSSTGPLSVWLSGNFANERIGAKWVERNSLEDQNSGIQDFVPFVARYAQGEVVKYTLDGTLRLFSARQELVKANFTDNLIPEPTGLSTDTYWEEINGTGLTTIKTWLQGAYKQDEVVVYTGQLLRAKRTFTSTVVPAAGADWELLTGGSGGVAYDDTALRGRVTELEADTTDLLTNIETAKTDLNARIDALVLAALPWRAGSYSQGEFVTSGGNVFIARQDIANSAVAPTSTNVYWLQVNGTSTGSGASYDDTELRSLINGKVDKVAGSSLMTSAEKTKLAGLQNYDETTLKNRVSTLETGKVDKVAGSSLITDAERTKLASLQNYSDSALAGRVTTLETAKVDKQAGYSLMSDAEKAKLAGLENFTLQPDSVDEDKLSPAVRTKLNATSSGTVDTIKDEQVLVAISGITENVGGVKAGSNYEGTLEGLVLKMLKTYQQPSFTYFAYNGEGSRTVEAGTVFNTIDTFSWATSNAANVKPSSITLKSDGAVVGSGLANDGSESMDIPSFTLDLNQSRSFEISGTNSQDEAFADSITINTALARYYGASSLTPAQLKAALGSTADGVLSNKDLGTGRGLEFNYNCSGGKYPYYLYRADLGLPGVVNQGPNTFSAYTVEEVTIKDRFSVSRSYNLLYTDTIQYSSSFNLKVN